MTNEKVKFKHFVDGEGSELYDLYVHGGDFSEELQDVHFYLSINDGELKVDVSEDDAEYFSTFNQAKWLKYIHDFVTTSSFLTTNGSKWNVVSEDEPVKVNKEKLAGLLEDFNEEEKQNAKPVSQPVSENKPANSRIANLLDDIEEEEAKENEEDAAVRKEQEAYNNLPVEQKIQKLYDKALAHAKAKDPDDIISTYVEDLYNPATTQLDKANLYLNLLILNRLQELDIFDFDFDEEVNSPSVYEYSLAHDFWKDIMNSEMDTETKYGNILDSNFRISFFSGLFKAIANNADKAAYNNYKRKWDAILADDDAPTQTLEDGVVNYVKEKSEEGSMIMITPDITPFFELDEKNKESILNSKENEINYLGIWNGRKIFEINVDKIAYLKGFKRGAFFIKKGNKFLINPEKPLAYLNVIENPFLEKPSLKFYSNIQVKIFNSAATFLRIEDI